MSDPKPLHRLFSLTWIDFFEGTPVVVKKDLDLSIKQQFLDLVFIRKGAEPIPRPLPDGFEDLSAHNLVTFKSYQEALDGWALLELVGHYINYRKQASPSLSALLPEDDFRLFAVCVRFPHNLAQQVELRPVRPGVYEVRVAHMHARVVVVHQLPLEEHNAMLHLFGAKSESLRYGGEHYRPQSEETSTLLLRLAQAYREDPDMADTLKELVRETIDELLKGLPAEELRKRLTPEERLEGLPPKERLKGLSAEEVVNALPPETLEALRQQLKVNGPSSKTQ
jgi:hypothetical protein